MESNPNSVSKIEAWVLKSSSKQAVPWALVPTYGHVVGIDVVISWVGLDGKLDTGNIIYGIKRKKVLMRSKCGRRVTHKTEKYKMATKGLLSHPEGVTCGILRRWPYLILTVSQKDWHRGVRQLPSRASQVAEPGFEPREAWSQGPSSSSRQTSFSNNTNLLLLASLGVCHEPGNTRSNFTYSSKPPYQLLCPFYKWGNWGSERLSTDIWSEFKSSVGRVCILSLVS